MADKATFDADLAALVTQFGTENQSVSALIAAIQAFFANPQVIDLTAEDDQVNALAQAVVTQATAVTNEIAQIPPPPGKPSA